jgi:glycosyltransferase involved in cell wall biosynthesis
MEIDHEKVIVDFIIPQFEDERIIRALKSITEHKFNKHFRIIIQDAGRDPVLRKKIGNSLRKNDLHLCEADEGIFDAINRGLSHVSAPWVGWLGADDFLAESFDLEPINNAREKDAFVSYVTKFFSEETGKITRIYSPINSPILRKLGCHLPHFSTFIRKNALLNRKFINSERNYADQFFFYELEREYKGIVTRKISTYMAEGGASNQSIRGVINTNWNLYCSFKKRSSKIKSIIYIIIKLTYKIIQKIKALLKAEYILAEQKKIKWIQ